jgi:hypothetical protein
MNRKSFLMGVAGLGIGSFIPKPKRTVKTERIKLFTTRLVDVRSSDYARIWHVLNNGIKLDIQLYESAIQAHIGAVGLYYEEKRLGGLDFHYNEILSPMIRTGHFEFEAELTSIEKCNSCPFVARATIYSVKTFEQ